MVVNPEQSQDFAKKYGQLVAKAWSDPAFRQRLMTDTRAVLQEHGIEVPKGLQVQAVENTEHILHLLLPQQPQNELADEQLEQVAGGDASFSTSGSLGPIGGSTLGTLSSAGSAGGL